MRPALPATLLAVALTLVLFTAPAQARSAPRCNGQAALCSRTFDQVVLAGAHNAMSSRSLGWRIPNQSVDIPAQLRYGIRALLFDSHYGRPQLDGTVKTDDDGTATGGVRGTYFCHVVCEIGYTPLVPGLRAIRKWLQANPRNVLAIDHEDHITPRDFVAAMKTSGLARYAYRGSTRHWPTLARMIASRQQVVVLAENHAGHAPWYHLAYDGILQETPYTWDQAPLITDAANWRASCVPNRGDRTGSLFLMNHWSPSTPPQVPDLAASAKVNARRVLVGRAKACRARRGRLPSIIAVDQVKAGGLLAAVRELNALGPR
jgi:hypothetical protein